MPDTPGVRPGDKQTLHVVRKWGTTPDTVEQSMRDQGMGVTAGAMWGPGRPLNPAWGYGGQPRKIDFRPGHNITGRPDRDGRVSFDALKQLTDSWDFAAICVRRRIDDIRSLDWTITAAPGVTDNVDTAIEYATQKMTYPEGGGSRVRYGTWLAKWLQSVLRYDAGCLYRRRDRAGRVCGLIPTPGRTIAPLLDTWGGTPESPAPAFTQWIRGQAVKQFTVDDLIYVPFMPDDNSPYGTAPLEAVVLAANTDLRQQAFFLQFFTSGTVPEGFATAPPDLSSPSQVEEWQQWWDATMYGDTEAKQQLKWVPAGTDFSFPKDRKFDKEFSMWMAGKCAAAFSVNMNDLGFIEDVNRSNGETQTEIQFRVGTLPLVRYLQDIITGYLQDDLGLPVEFIIDAGQEKDDRLAEAQAHKIWVELGAESPDEIRETILGLPIDNERPVPRFVMHTRRGPIPLLDIVSAGGKVDGETFGPARDQDMLPLNVDVPGVVPQEGTDLNAAAAAANNQAELAARQALHPDAPPVPSGDAPVQASVTAGITAGTGFTGNPQVAGRPKVDEDDGPLDLVVKSVLGALNDRKDRTAAGGVPVVKAEDRASVTVAGLAVKAADTGRVLMLQRALDPTVCPGCGVGVMWDGQDGCWLHGDGSIGCHDESGTECSDHIRDKPDPAAGRFEFPGGHLESGEDPLAGAAREWTEEVGAPVPPGVNGGTWTSPSGVYWCVVWVVPSESTVQINTDPDQRAVLNPDDPDRDRAETVAWFDPGDLPGMPSLRQEMAATVDSWMPVVTGAGMRQATEVRKQLATWRNIARRRAAIGADDPARFVTDVIPETVRRMVAARLDGARTRADVDGAFTVVVKAGRGKGGWRDGAPDTPQRQYDLRITDHYAPLIQTALGRLWPAVAVRAAAQAGTVDGLPPADDGPLRQVMGGLWADAWTTGWHAAGLQVARVRKAATAPPVDVGIDWDRWEPGNLDAAILAADGGYAAVLARSETVITGITGTALDRVGTVLAEGMLNGDSVDTIARALARMLGGDLDRAELIAHTETARLQETASMGRYADLGVREWDWLISSGACPRCVDQEMQNPHPVSEVPKIPAHPRCRCSSAPRWQSIQ
jgi:8-oxo-dGTP pyrophosphatase MutT (NUDIX family)